MEQFQNQNRTNQDREIGTKGNLHYYESHVKLTIILQSLNFVTIFYFYFHRYTHNEKRYHSEVRQEAVQQALAAINQGKQNNNALGVPMPSKRSSVMQRSSANGDDVSK